MAAGRLSYAWFKPRHFLSKTYKADLILSKIWPVSSSDGQQGLLNKPGTRHRQIFLLLVWTWVEFLGILVSRECLKEFCDHYTYERPELFFQSEYYKQEVVRPIFHVRGEFHLTSSAGLFSWIFWGNRQKETLQLLIIKNRFCDKTKNMSMLNSVPSAWDS